jgi:hypothetical protein
MSPAVKNGRVSVYVRVSRALMDIMKRDSHYSSDECDQELYLRRVVCVREHE